MPLSFEGVVRSVVRKLDHSGELIPVDSLRNSARFRPYRLLSRKPRGSWFWRSRYTDTHLSIKDILEPDAPEPDLTPAGCFHISDATDGQLTGKMELAMPGQGKISGGAALSSSSSTSMDVCTLQVDPSTWEAMQQERRLRQPGPKILQQLQSCGHNLYVVTEVLQTQEEVKVTRTHSLEGSGQCALPVTMCWQGDGQGHLNRKNTVTVPAGSILAFRVAQLIIHSDSDWGERETGVVCRPGPCDQKAGMGYCSLWLHGLWGKVAELPGSALRVPGRGAPWERKAREPSPRVYSHLLLDILFILDEKQRTFGPPPSDGASEEWVVTRDFQGLRAEVEAGRMALGQMESSLRQQLLQDLRQVLRDPQALRDLEALLEWGLDGKRQLEPLDGPAGAILECLVLPSRRLVPVLAAPVVYLLGALTALSESQQELLAEALDAGSLLAQLKLVEHLLQQSSPWQAQGAVPLPSRLLGSSWGEDAPGWALLQACGLELQVGPPQVHWEPQAQGPACALYASLALMSGLSQEPC
ncbi:gasdermin-D [Ctenodactylus gundi]